MADRGLERGERARMSAVVAVPGLLACPDSRDHGLRTGVGPTGLSSSWARAAPRFVFDADGLGGGPGYMEIRLACMDLLPPATADFDRREPSVMRGS